MQLCAFSPQHVSLSSQHVLQASSCFQHAVLWQHDFCMHTLCNDKNTIVLFYSSELSRSFPRSFSLNRDPLCDSQSSASAMRHLKHHSFIPNSRAIHFPLILGSIRSCLRQSTAWSLPKIDLLHPASDTHCIFRHKGSSDKA